MNDYTTYCTEEQTRKALELGAPIETCGYYYKKQIGCNTISDTDLHIIPTVDQMIGWLEEQELIESIEINKQIVTWTGYVWLVIGRIKLQSFSSRKEATLAAIDTALDYLILYKK